MSQSRQLAAIMFTDIVGYAALMGEDEQKAFELLKKNRLVQRPIIEEHNGRWLKEIGDGVLASFNAISDAVYCAKAIQKACENEPDLKLRIGIHEGEVVFEGDDVFGDGVNIASRLEPLAPIGGILVSESVNRNLGNKKGIETNFVREETLKNVKDPIKIYSVQVEYVDSVVIPESIVVSKPTKPRKVAFTVVGVLLILLLSYFLYSKFSAQQQLADIPPEVTDKSIAVLPFDTITKDSASQYIADGIREAILNNLFKIDELRVGSRTSATTYRNSPKRVPEIASELGVATIMEGSAQKFGDQIRITVQLIDGKTDNHLWSEEYDRDWGDIFAIYSEIAEKVASALQVVITPEEKQQIATTPISNATAYDYILQAREEQMKYWFQNDTTALKKAETLYYQALAIDPLYAPGWVKLGSIYWDRHNHANVHSKDYFEKNYQDSVLWYCDKAIALDSQASNAYSLKGMVFHIRGNIDLAIENYENALEFVSNDDNNVAWETSWRLGYIYIFKKDIVKGISLIRQAVLEAKDSPQDYRHMIRRLGWAYMFIGAYEEAVNYFITEISLGGNNFEFCRADAYQRNIQVSIDCSMTRCQTDSTFYECNYYQANNYLQLREFETSVKYFQKVRDGNEELARIKYYNLYREGFALIQMGYTEEGLKITEESLSELEIRKKLRRSDGHDYHLAAIYASRGEKKRALQHLQDYRDNVIFLPPNANLIPISFSQHDIMFESLWDDKEFQAIVRRDHEEKETAITQLREMEEQWELDL